MTEAFPLRRYAALSAIALVWMAAVAFRLFHLQILHHHEFAARAQRQRQRTIEVSPKRGVLYDRNLHELAVSVQVDSVFAVPSEIAHPENTLALLKPILNIDVHALRTRMIAGRPFLWIKRKVSDQESQRVRALNLKGVYLQKENKRFYPKGELAAHLLGYVGLDENGLGGIEQQFDKQVHGRPGQVLIQADAHSRYFGREDEHTGEAGENVVLTIDENIQFLVERELTAAVAKEHPKAATVVVLDTNTGEILALANRPTFNPNELKATSAEVWQNRAVSAAYEPGSTMKVVTIAAALDSKLTRPDEVIDCQMGQINVFGRVIHDHKPYGNLTVTGIMANSSDVGAIKLGLRLGDERMYRYMKAFGLGTKTGVELPGETVGLTRPPEQWSRSSIGSISMGQELGATALQMASAMSVIANDGVWQRPRIVRQVFKPGKRGLSLAPASVQASGPRDLPGGRRVVSRQTAIEVRQMLEQVVLAGTGPAAKLKGYSSAGKTGTAQKYDPNTGTYSKSNYVASFIGFAPVNNPAVTIAVILDSPTGMHQGGQVAAPIFKSIAEKVLAHLETPHDLPVADETKARPVDLAQVTDFAPVQAEERESLGPAVQDPDATRFLALEGAPLVPKFLGRSLREVAEVAMSQSLEVELLGSGVASEQVPSPGARLLPGRKIVVKFSR